MTIKPEKKAIVTLRTLVYDLLKTFPEGDFHEETNLGMHEGASNGKSYGTKGKAYINRHDGKLIIVVQTDTVKK